MEQILIDFRCHIQSHRTHYMDTLGPHSSSWLDLEWRGFLLRYTKLFRVDMIRTLIFCAFFLSGFCALSLEVLWTRMLTLIFGGSSLAITTILTTYMAGLAWGSAWAGKRAESIQYPARMYALFECIIGCWGLFVPFLLIPISGVYRWLPLEQAPFLLAGLRFFSAFVVLLLPTWLMGATLPLLSRYLEQSPSVLEQDVSRLYTLNTAGAVLGCLCTGLFVLPYIGLSKGLYWIAGANITLGIGLYFSLQRFSKKTNASKSLHNPNAAQSEHTTSLQHSAPKSIQQEGKEQLVLSQDEALQTDLEALDTTWSDSTHTLRWLFAITGILAMLCQVVWGRVLSMLIGSSIYAFTWVLAVFLFGLACGSGLGTLYITRIHRPLMALAWTLLGTAFCITWGIWSMDKIPLWFLYWTQQLPLNAVFIFGLKALVVTLVVLPPTLCMGLLFPLILKAYTTSKQPLTQIVGKLYAYNTVGAIVGSLSTGFLWIPWLGTQWSLQLVVGLYIVLAIWLGLRAEFSTPLWSRLSFSVASLLCVGCVFISLDTWKTHHLSLGLFRASQLKRMRTHTQAIQDHIVFYKEGLSATVAVERYGRHFVLKVNGKPDASTGEDMPTQILAGLIPLTLHPRAQTGLVIGWGSGVTVGSALQFPLRSLTAVELEPAVVQGARFFRPWNHTPRQDKRLKLMYQDGRHILTTHKTTWDVIISEPSNPWISGVASLFTYEFFQQVSKRLHPQGVFCQWVQLYELSPRTIRSLFKTVISVFPYVYLWSPSYGSKDSLLLASHQPLTQRWALHTIQKQVFRAHSRSRSEYTRAGLLGALDLVPRLLADTQELKRIVRDAPLNTDDNGFVEWTAPLELLTHAQMDGKAWLRSQIKHQKERALRIFQVPQSIAQTIPFQIQLALAYMRFGDIKTVRAWVIRWKRTAPNSLQHRLRKLDWIVRRLLAPPSQLQLCIQKNTGKGRAPLRVTDCWKQIHLTLPQRGHATFESWLRRSSTDPEKRLLLGFLAYAQKRYAQSLTALAPLSKDAQFLKKYPGICFLLGDLYRRSKIWPEAVWFMQLYLRYRPSHTPNRYNP